MKRFLITIAVVIVLLLGALVAVPYFFKDRIIALVKEKANENLTAKFDFDDLDLSLLRSFPNASVRLENVRVTTAAVPFAGDTLLYCHALDVTADPVAYIQQKTVSILALTLDKPLVNLRVAGDTVQAFKNWDVTKPSPPDTAQNQAPSRMKIALKKYEIKDGTFRFRSDVAEREFTLANLNHTGSGDFARDVFTLSTKSEALMTFVNGGVAYLSNAQTALQMDVSADIRAMKFTFANNELTLNALKAAFEGYFAMPEEGFEFDIRFATKNNDFKNLLSLVPAMYTSTFSDVKSSGTASIQGFVKGLYNDSTYPGFDMKIIAENGAFQYPKLPVGISRFFMDCQVKSSGGASFDALVVALRRASMLVGQDPFEMNAEVRTPVSDLYVNLNAKGRVNLDNVKQLIPPEKLEGKEISGLVEADIHFQAAMSAVKSKLYNQIKASGSMTAERLVFGSAALPEKVNVTKASLFLSPQNAALRQCDITLGKSDLHLTGTFDNIIGYVLNAPADSILKGSLNLSSTYFDCNPWLKDSTQKEKTQTADTVFTAVELPANLDFTFAARMQKVNYTNLALDDVQGRMILRDKTLRLENVGMKIFGGSVVVSGSYDTRTANAPKTAFDLAITTIDIPKTFTAFSSLQAIAPMTQAMRGAFSAKLSLATDLDGGLKPVWNSFNSAGGLTISPLKLEGFKPLNQVADLLNLDFLRDPTILKVNPYYEIKDGRLYIKPFSVKIGGQDVLISGSNGLDKSIDYTLTVNLPADKIPSGTLAAIPVLGGLVDKVKNKPIPINIKIGGTFENPVITPLVAGGSVEDAAKQALDAVQEEAKKRAQEEIDKAQQKLKEEADKKAKELEQKAKEEAEKKAKDALKDKLPSSLKNLFGGSKQDTTKK
jgi:uncharacterized protein involved in outer membrane biogenesis